MYVIDNVAIPSAVIMAVCIEMRDFFVLCALRIWGIRA